MGPATTTTTHPPVPAARLSDHGPERQGRLTAAPASPARLRPVLDPHDPLTRTGSSREQGRPRPQVGHTRPAGQSGMPATAGNTDKDL
jgi:hypothetical protein